MALTVEQLSKSLITNSSVNDIIKEHLLIIDKQIMRHDKIIGENTVTYELPSIFPALPTETSTTKKIIYSKLIESLESRGFKCGIKIIKKGEKAHLVITWTIAVDNIELQRIDSYLETKIIKDNTP